MEDPTGSAEGHKLIGLIADEETCSGFLLAGIGESANERHNYFAVDDATADDEIATFFQQLYNRRDIAIIMIGSNVARRITTVLSERTKVLPIIVEIPTKYELAKNIATGHF